MSDLVLAAVTAELRGPTSTSDWAHFLAAEIEVTHVSAKYTAADGTVDTTLTALDKSRTRAFIAKWAEAAPRGRAHHNAGGPRSGGTTGAQEDQAVISIARPRR